MNAVYLFLFVLLCMAIALWAVMRAKAGSKRTSRSRSSRKSGSSSALSADERLRTPAVSALSSKEEVWAARRREAGSIDAEREPAPYARAWTLDQDGDYDGYSRRNRHRVSPAPVKKTAVKKDRRAGGGGKN